jgi:hypothetical protein
MQGEPVSNPKQWLFKLYVLDSQGNILRRSMGFLPNGNWLVATLHAFRGFLTTTGRTWTNIDWTRLVAENHLGERLHFNDVVVGWGDNVILQLTAPFHLGAGQQFPVINWGRIPQIGEEVTMYGFALDTMQQLYVRGPIVGTGYFAVYPNAMAFLSRPIGLTQPGDSGAPILDANGHIIGVNSGTPDMTTMEDDQLWYPFANEPSLYHYITGLVANLAVVFQHFALLLQWGAGGGPSKTSTRSD